MKLDRNRFAVFLFVGACQLVLASCAKPAEQLKNEDSANVDERGSETAQLDGATEKGLIGLKDEICHALIDLRNDPLRMRHLQDGLARAALTARVWREYWYDDHLMPATRINELERRQSIQVDWSLLNLGKEPLMILFRGPDLNMPESGGINEIRLLYGYRFQLVFVVDQPSTPGDLTFTGAIVVCDDKPEY